MEYSNFMIHIELPNGTKQIVWEQTVEGDISTNKKMDQYVEELESAGHKVVSAKRQVFGGKSLFYKILHNKENFIGKIYKNPIEKI
tara:strand:- start:146 stop:403 length:258 start_codon:yes stop_codon:yes gene_type:complete